MRKEKWGKPKLIILTRGKPEERMLSACKAGSGISGPAGSNGACLIVSCGIDCASLLAS